jgi:hypothetical protein
MQVRDAVCGSPACDVATAVATATAVASPRHIIVCCVCCAFDAMPALTLDRSDQSGGNTHSEHSDHDRVRKLQRAFGEEGKQKGVGNRRNHTNDASMSCTSESHPPPSPASTSCCPYNNTAVGLQRMKRRRSPSQIVNTERVDVCEQRQ